jgi:hypothetical protein
LIWLDRESIITRWDHAYYFTTDVGKTPLKRKVTNTSVIRCIKNTPSSNSYLWNLNSHIVLDYRICSWARNQFGIKNNKYDHNLFSGLFSCTSIKFRWIVEIMWQVAHYNRHILQITRGKTIKVNTYSFLPNLKIAVSRFQLNFKYYVILFIYI